MMPVHDRKKLALLACLALLGTFVAQQAAFLRANGQTFDEGLHLTAGYSYLMRHDFRMTPDHPPLTKELAALAVYASYRLPFEPPPHLWEDGGGQMWTISHRFIDGSPVPAEDILTRGRLPNAVLGALLVALVGWWSYRAWGEAAAVVGTALAALEPNLVAHSCLVTTDLGVTVFGCLAFYLAWEYSRRRSPALLLGVGLACGLALASKYSALLVVGALALGLAADVVWPAPGVPSFGRRLARAAAVVGAVLALAAFVILPVYFFQGFTPWLDGLRGLLVHEARGHPAFLLGQYSHTGWWYYFPVAFAIKTPAGSLALILLSLLLFRLGKPFGRREFLFLLLPVLLMFLGTARAHINVGLRHILPVYPLLFVAAARVATVSFRRVWLAPAVVGALLALTGVSALRVAPHQLAYFNEFVGGPGEGYRYLSDTNLDWGQDLKGLKEYTDREGLPMIYLAYFGTAPPGKHGISYQYAPGSCPTEGPAQATGRLPPGSPREVLAISVTCLQGTYSDPHDLYHWLYRRTPVAKVGYTIYVYDITGDTDAHLELAKVYRRAGLRELARAELDRVLAREPDNAEAAELLKEVGD
jgi:hypothetical protein